MEIRSNRALIGRLTSQVEGKLLLLVLGSLVPRLFLVEERAW